MYIYIMDKFTLGLMWLNASPTAGNAHHTGDFPLGLTLMLIGMIAVFVVLLIVICLSKLLIAAINRFAPDEVVATKQQQQQRQQPPPQTQAVSPVVLRVVSQAVAQVTGGRGAVKAVEKI